MVDYVSVLLDVKPDIAGPAPHPSGIPVWLFIVLIIIIAAAAYFLANYLAKSMNEKFIHEQQQDAENIILVSREKAQLIESDAKDVFRKNVSTWITVSKKLNSAKITLINAKAPLTNDRTISKKCRQNSLKSYSVFPI